MGNDESVRFMREHSIPIDRIDFTKLSPQQREYEKQIFGRNIGGNAFDSEKQYNLGKQTAQRWKRISRGARDYSILDVGCGQGYHVYFMERLGLKAYGLNLSVVEAELAMHGKPDNAKVMKWRDDVSREIKIASATKIPYEDERFDGVACYGMLMMTPHSEKLFGGNKRPIEVAETVCSEIHRIMKPGGQFHLITRSLSKGPAGEMTEDYINFSEKGYAVYDIEGKIIDKGRIGMKKLLKDAGFEVLGMKEMDSGYWSCKAQK